MSAIRNNPYRILGLFSNTTEKELQKHIAILNRYSEVGKLKSFDCDFPFWGDVRREKQSVIEAASKIELAKNKIHFALFWFLNSSHIDEAALNNLKEGHVDKAAEIWEKTLKDSVVTSKNFSAISNLSTLKLGLITYNGSFDLEIFTASLELKGRLLLSEVFNNFITTVIGEDISINHDIVFKEFADEILQIVKPYLNKPNGLKSNQLINAFKSFPNEIKQYVSGKFTDRPLSNIESQIEKTKQKREDNPNDAEEYGKELYKNTKEDLVFLKNVWGSNNVQYQMIANKLANEILQCAVDFFVEYRDRDEYDPGEPAMKLMKMAKAINPTGQIKSRLDENIENVQEWINDKPNRDKQNIVRDDLKFIIDKLEKFQSSDDTISNALNFANSCKPRIDNMKLKLGAHDELFSKISTAVASNAQGMIVSAVNEAIRRNEIPYAPEYSLETLQDVVSDAWEATVSLGIFDMSSKQREHYNKNKSSLKDLYKQLNTGIVFFGDTAVQKWILWVVGIGIVILIFNL